MPNKKHHLLHVIQQIENHSTDLPLNLKQKLSQAKNKLNTLSKQEVETLDGAVNTPADKHSFEQNNPIYLLNEVYSDLERYYFTKNNRDPEMKHIIKQMRGLFDIPDRYFP